MEIKSVFVLAVDLCPALPNFGTPTVVLALGHRIVEVGQNACTRFVFRRLDLANTRVGRVRETAGFF